MRPYPALILGVLVAAGCGGDEPAEEQAPVPAEETREEARPVPPAPAPAEPQQTEAESTPDREPAGTEAAPVMDRDLYTVQVAAFLNPTTARMWASRLQDQQLPVWTTEARIGGRTFHRLRIGALPSLSDARRLGDRITDRYGWPVWIAPVTTGDRLPVDAVRDTRRVLQGG